MTAWWDIGRAARAAIRRPTEEEYRLDTKDFFIRQTVIWGEIAGIKDAGYMYPFRTLLWMRYDPRFLKFMLEIDEDVERRPLAFVDRRMSEGDRSAVLARLRTTRAPAKPRKQDGEKPAFLVHPSAPEEIVNAAYQAWGKLSAEKQAYCDQLIGRTVKW